MTASAHAHGPTHSPASAGLPARALRASDSERAATADELRRHAGAGRLEMDELDERVARALTARSRAELDTLLADLPAAATAMPKPAPAPAPAPAAADCGDPWRAYLAVMALLVGIWLITGAGHPWPLYPALGWGIPLLVASRSAPRGEHPAMRAG